MTIVKGYATQDEFISRYMSNGADITEYTPPNAGVKRNIDNIITGVSRLIDNYTGREFYPSDPHAARTFNASAPDLCFVDALISIDTDGLKTDEDGDGVYETVWALTDYLTNPQNSTPILSIETTDWGAHTFPQGKARVQITGTWGYCEAPASVAEIRAFTADSPYFCFIDPLVSIITNGLTTDDNADGVFETTWSSGDFTLMPVDGPTYSFIQVAAAKQFPLTLNAVKVAGTWNQLTAPAVVQEACYLQSYRLFMRSAAPFGVAGGGDMGQAIAIAKLDPDLELLLFPLAKVLP